MDDASEEPPRVSGRRAAELLAWAGLGERQARQVLRAGLAGRPERVGSMLLYDSARVRALMEAPVLNVDKVAPRGLFVARKVGLDAEFDFSPWTAAFLQHRLECEGPRPAVTSGDMLVRVPTGPGRPWALVGHWRP